MTRRIPVTVFLSVPCSSWHLGTSKEWDIQQLGTFSQSWFTLLSGSVAGVKPFTSLAMRTEARGPNEPVTRQEMEDPHDHLVFMM